MDKINIFRKWYILFVFCAAVYGIERFCHKQTEGFRLSHIFIHLPESDTLIEPPKVLYQPFHYMGKGGQFYVFLSEDKQYVLKFFKGNHIKSLKLNNLIDSCFIAEDVLTKECGLVYSHLYNTPSNAIPITLFDKLHIAHKIDARSTGFILQRYALPVQAHITKLMEQQEDAQASLNSLIAMIQECKDKGISHSDANVLTNCGFIDNQPVFTDIGNFSYSQNPQVKIKGIASLSLWLDTYYPNLNL